MNILIIGAGAIGIAMGASLAAHGEEISYIATPKTGKLIEAEGITRVGLFGEAHADAGSIKVFYEYADLPSDYYDYVIICAKTMANEQIARSLHEYRSCMKAGGIIVIMQNGWGNDLPYLEYFEVSVVYNARVITGFARISPNVSKITVHTAPVMIGSLHGCPKEKAGLLAQAIDESGIPCVVTDEVGKALWAKMLYNCTLNPLGAILKVPYGKLADSPATADIMNRLIRETFAVMKAAGYESFWDTPEAYIEEFYSKLIPDTYAHCSSTYQDMEKKQKTEIETLTGCIIRLAREHGIEVPTHKTIYEEVLFLESQYLG